jgi:hypothetical protein
VITKEYKEQADRPILQPSEESQPPALRDWRCWEGFEAPDGRNPVGCRSMCRRYGQLRTSTQIQPHSEDLVKVQIFLPNLGQILQLRISCTHPLAFRI